MNSIKVSEWDLQNLGDTTFLSDVWPIVEMALPRLFPIYRFAHTAGEQFLMNESLTLYKEYQISRVNSSLAILKSPSTLSVEQIKELKYTSFYNGHLNLIYSASKHDPIIDQLKSLLNFNRSYVGSVSDNPQLDWTAFQSLIYPYLGGQTRLFGFGHDGESLCIFDAD